MLAQYYSNAYFPQISPEEAVPLEADLQATATISYSTEQSSKPSVARKSKLPAPATGETAPPLEEPTPV
jgi:hypothetical protein